MSLPSCVGDIMVREVITCSGEDTLARARALMADHQIRHIPVIDESRRLVGLVTQRDILKEAFKIADRFGMDELERHEKRIRVSDVMDTRPATITPDLPLQEAGKFFLESRHGCLPVLDKGELTGILSSMDFVKLSLQLLRG